MRNNILSIDADTTINSVQNYFSSLYPYLRIEFFREPHIAGKGSAKNKMITSNQKLSEIQKIKSNGHIEINGNASVMDLEKHFEEKFGLYIQVFRKSGNVWLETSATDNWTLVQQNEEGEILAKHFKTEFENPNDHDIY